jgi:uncharacterized membrane protein YhaH (DUF805 family)
MNWMFVPFARYADFSGRSRRKEFWMFQLLNMLVICAFAVILAGSALSEGEWTSMQIAAAGLLVVWMLGILIPSLAVQVRRFHDQDKSGWFVLLGVIPYLGGLILFVFMLFEGTRGPNRFGDDPKAAEIGG